MDTDEPKTADDIAKEEFEAVLEGSHTEPLDPPQPETRAEPEPEGVDDGEEVDEGSPESVADDGEAGEGAEGDAPEGDGGDEGEADTEEAEKGAEETPAPDIEADLKRYVDSRYGDLNRKYQTAEQTNQQLRNEIGELRKQRERDAATAKRSADRAAVDREGEELRKKQDTEFAALLEKYNAGDAELSEIIDLRSKQAADMADIARKTAAVETEPEPQPDPAPKPDEQRASPDPSPPGALTDEQRAQELTKLEAVHPDWNQHVQNEEFRRWVNADAMRVASANSDEADPNISLLGQWKAELTRREKEEEAKRAQVSPKPKPGPGRRQVRKTAAEIEAEEFERAAKDIGLEL